MLVLWQHFGGLTLSRARVSLHCGDSFTISNVVPGAYELSANVLDVPAAKRNFADVEVSISDEDVDIVLPLAAPRPLTGRIKMPDGAPALPLERLTVGLQPLGTLPFPDEATPVRVAGDGRFTLWLFGRKNYEVIVRGLEQPYCVKTIAYNGSDLPAAVFSPNLYSLDQTLEIAVSDRAAILDGTVARGESAASNVKVLVAPWPLQMKANHPAFELVTTDENGHFVCPPLPPGTYRILTYDAAAQSRLERPYELAQALFGAPAVELSDGIRKSLSLKLLLYQ